MGEGDETTMWPSVGHALSMVESCEGCSKQHARGRQYSAAQGWRVEEKKTINTFLSSSVFSLSPFYKLEGFFSLSLSEWTTDLPSLISLCVSLYLSKAVLLAFFFCTYQSILSGGLCIPSLLLLLPIREI